MRKPFFALFSPWSVLLSLVLLANPAAPYPAALRGGTTLDVVLDVAAQLINSIPTAILNNTAKMLPLPSTKFTITQHSPTPGLRAAAIAMKRVALLYGPPIAGGPYFPSGPLGQARVALDQAFIKQDLAPQLALAVADAASAVAGLPKVRIRPTQITFRKCSLMFSMMFYKRSKLTPSSTTENGREPFQEDQILGSRLTFPRIFYSPWSVCLSVRTQCEDSIHCRTLAPFKSMIARPGRFPG